MGESLLRQNEKDDGRTQSSLFIVSMFAVDMTRPIVLQLGDDIRWNHELHELFAARFDIRRSYSMSRPQFLKALEQGDFGDFLAIYRPFWNTGGEMGSWDAELISLLPKSCKIYASAGAGFDWVDTKKLAERGTTNEAHPTPLTD